MKLNHLPLPEPTHDDCSVHEPCELKQPTRCPLEHVRLKRAAVKAGEWGKLLVVVQPGGLRHFLDAKPVHCGEVLQLQHRGEQSDEWGEYSVPLLQSSAVRYEASQNGKKIDVTLYFYVGSHEFTSPLEPWMRFRWPGPR